MPKEARKGVQVFLDGEQLKAPEGDEWVAVYKSILLADFESGKILVARIEKLESEKDALRGLVQGLVTYVNGD